MKHVSRGWRQLIAFARSQAAQLAALALFLNSTACTNAITEFLNAGSEFPRPSVHRSDKLYLLESLSGSVTISGNCDPLTETLELQAPFDLAPVAASSVATAGSDVDCADGNFNLEIPASPAYWGTQFGFTSGTDAQGNLVIRAVKGDVAGDETVAIRYLSVVPNVSLAVLDSSPNEGDSARFAVNLSATSSFPLTVQWQTVDGLATADVDYVNRTESITFSPGVSSITLVANTIQDNVYETNESFYVNLVSASGGRLAAPFSSLIFILNDDATPTLTLSYSGPTTEGQNASLSATLNTISGVDAVFDWSSWDISAFAGSDYTSLGSGQVTIAAGSTTANIEFPITNDAVYEADESFVVTFTSVSHVSVATNAITVTIDDNDSMPTIQILDTMIGEGSTAAAWAVLSAAAGAAVTVTFSTYPGSATVASDYLSASGVLTVPAGSLSASIQVLTVQDTLYELSEVFSLSLSGAKNASISDALGSVLINDNDAMPKVYISDSAVSEGETLLFVITLSDLSSFNTEFDYTINDISASSSEPDYIAALNGRLTILPGLDRITLSVPSIEDGKFEADETLAVALLNLAYSAAGDVAATGTISNDDSAPTLFANSTFATEGDAILIVLTLNAISGLPFVFDWQTVAGTALAGSDFTNQSLKQVTVAAGVQGITLNVATTEDLVFEGTESLTAEFVPVANVALASPSVSLDIIDDDAMPLLFALDATATEGGSIVVNVTMSATAGTSVTFDWATLGGTASSGTDYTPASSTATIQPSSLSAALTIATTDDLIFEPTEYLTVTIANAISATVSDGLSQITLSDDEPTPGLFASIDPVASEGNTLAFVITLSGLRLFETTFNYSFTNGSASATDYTGTPGTATVAALAWSTTILVPTTEDTLFEDDEAFSLNLSAYPNIVDGAAIGTIDNDDSAPELSVYNASVVEGETATIAVSLSAISGVDTEFTWQTLEDTATSLDFTAVATTVITIPAGQSSALLSVITSEDLVSEATENLAVTLTSPLNATFLDDNATVSIIDDDGLPLLYVVTTPSVSEGQPASVQVTMSAVSGQDVTFQYYTSDDTAAAPDDYTALSAGISTATISAGLLQTTLSVSTIDDTMDEPSTETLRIHITSASNANIATAANLATIEDNDNPPTIHILQSEAEEGSPITFAITISAISGLDINASWQTYTNSATADDYDSAANGPIQILSGSLTTFAQVNTTEDTNFETDEDFLISLSALSNASAGVLFDKGTITNDDLAPSLLVHDATGSEGSTALVVVSLSELSAIEVTFEFSTADATATTLSQDYVSTSGTGTIPAGFYSTTIPVIFSHHTVVDEHNETAHLNISNAANISAIIDSIALLTILDIDPAPFIKIYPAATPEGGIANLVVSLSTMSGKYIDFNYSTADDTADSGIDYTQVSSTPSGIAAGQLSTTLTLSTNNDSIYEGSAERFVVTLSGFSSASLDSPGDGWAYVDITDIDSMPSLFISDSTGVEGDSLIFLISISGESALASTFQMTTMNGSATDTDDFTAVSGADFTIPAGALSITASIASTGDLISEPAIETFEVTLTSLTNVAPGDTGATGSIQDDDDPRVYILDASNSEGGQILFLVSMDTANASNVTFNYTHYDGSASVASGDYTAPVGTTGTIFAGQLTTAILIDTSIDNTFELDENFLLSLSAISNAVGGDVLATGTIVNSDAIPTLFVYDQSVTEGETLSFVISLNRKSYQIVYFDLSTSDLSATLSDVDYNAVSMANQIPAGALAITVPVISNQDLRYETNETFSLSVNNIVNASNTTASAIGTILNDETAPTLSLLDSGSYPESQFAVLTASLSAISGLDSEFTWRTYDQSAVAGLDYAAVPVTSVTIPGGSLTAAIAITITNDSLANEFSERLLITLTPASGLNPAEASGFVDISDDDTTSIFILDASGSEGTDLVFQITMTNPSATAIPGTFLLYDGSATLVSGDYQPWGASTSYNIASFSIFGTITIQAMDDSIYEVPETFQVSLSTFPGAIAGDTVANGTIFNTDSQPTWTLSSNTPVEGASAEIYVTLSQPSGLPTILYWETLDVTASSSDDDFVASSGNAITIAAGTATGTILVETLDDALDENDTEDFVVSIASAVNASASAPAHEAITVSISDDDMMPTIHVLTVDTLEDSSAIVTVSLSEISGREVSFDLSTTASSTQPLALSGDDYTPISGTYTIPAAATMTLAIPIPIVDDTYDEYDEKFRVEISSIQFAAPGSILSDVTIIDNDAEPDLILNTDTALEGETIEFIVSLSGLSGREVSFNFTLLDGSATVATDYSSAGPYDLTIPAGQDSITIAVSTTQNTTYEATEFFWLQVYNELNATFSGSNSIAGSITDDDLANRPVAAVYDSVNTESGHLDFTISLNKLSGAATTVSLQSIAGIVTLPGGMLADAGTDFVAANYVITIGAGYTMHTARITVNNDSNYEGTENFAVSLSAIEHTTISDGFASGFIFDDDCPSTGWCQWNNHYYLKAAIPGQLDEFGTAVAISNDTLVVGAPAEDSSVTGVTNGTSGSINNSLTNAGAAYIFKRSGGMWTQEAMLKSADPLNTDKFGSSAAISGDTVIVGVPNESSSLSGIINGLGGHTGTGASASGAAFIYRRTNSTWAQEAALKAPDPSSFEYFGYSLSIDNETAVVGAYGEGSTISGVINGTDGATGSGAAASGAAYIFRRIGTTWQQEATLKAPDSLAGDYFGWSIAVNSDTVVVGANQEDSNSSGVINGTGGALGFSSSGAGAAYVYRRIGNSWRSEATLKAADPAAGDYFGQSTSIYGDTILVGANREDSSQSGVLNGTGGAIVAGATDSGAAYVFKRTGNTWVQEAVLKAALPAFADDFGYSLNLHGDLAVIGAHYEDSGYSAVINGTSDPAGTELANSGAAYVFKRYGNTWVQEAVLKSANAQAIDYFGNSTAIQGDTIAIGARTEDSSRASLVSTPIDNVKKSLPDSGAAYIFSYRGSPSVLIQQAANQSDPTSNSTIQFTVEFSSPLIPGTFSTSDITQDGDAMGMAWVISGLGDNRRFLLTASGGTTGYYKPTIAAGAVTDVNGFTNLASSPNMDNSVKYYIPQVYVTDVTLTEGQTLFAQVTMDAATDLPVVVNVATADGTATMWADYSPMTETVTIAPGSTSAQISMITTVDNVIIDANRHFFLNITAASAVIGDGSAMISIINNDLPNLFISDAVAIEGQTLSFQISLSEINPNPITFAYSTVSGSAVGGSDYLNVTNQIVTIPANSLTPAQPIRVIATNDALAESLEQFYVQLSQPNQVRFIDNIGFAQIIDNDTIPSIGINDVQVYEGNTAIFTVSLSGPYNSFVSVNWQTVDGTAVTSGGGANHDYVASSGTLTIPANTYMGTITIATLINGADSTTETFNLQLNSPINGTLIDTSGIGTIVDTGQLPSVSVLDTSVYEGEDLLIVISVSQPFGTVINFNWELFQNTATVSSDFGPGSGGYFIPIGFMAITLNVGMAFSDLDVENIENLIVSITGVTNATVADNTGIIEILDDDCPTVGWCGAAFLKGSNSMASDELGTSVAISESLAIVGAKAEGSDVTGVVNGATTFTNTNSLGSGAAYLYSKASGSWQQEAYVKAPDPVPSDSFGTSVGLSRDTIVVSVPFEDSSISGVINGTGGAFNSGQPSSGAVHVYRKVAGLWEVEATLKASNPMTNDAFGASIDFDDDTVVVGAPNEDGIETSIVNGTGAGALGAVTLNSGAAYVFHRTGNTWVQEAYLKAPDSMDGDNFGSSVAIDRDTIIVGAPNEDSALTGVINGTGGGADGAPLDRYGAAYVFQRTGNTWANQAYLKAAVARQLNQFGSSVDIHGETAVVGTPGEASASIGVTNGTGGSINTGAPSSGAAFVFLRTNQTWVQQAYLKAADPLSSDQFGKVVAIYGDNIVVGARNEGSTTTGVSNGTLGSNSGTLTNAGAAYAFRRTDSTWVQSAYLKAPDYFGSSAQEYFGISVNAGPGQIIIGSTGEDSAIRGVLNGRWGGRDSGRSNSGAAYIFKLYGPNDVIVRQAKDQPDPALTNTIRFEVEFARKINAPNFMTSKIQQTGTATGMTWTVLNSGDDRNFIIEASGGTSGTYQPIIEQTIWDGVGFNGPTSTGFDNIVTLP